MCKLFCSQQISISQFRTPTPISPQNIINGPQPANFQARSKTGQASSQTPFGQQSQSFGRPDVTSTNKQEAPLQATQQSEQKVDPVDSNAKFESILASYTNSKAQLIEEMKQLSIVTELLDEKSTNFDTGKQQKSEKALELTFRVH